MSSSPVSTRPANVLMGLTYAIAAFGIGLAFSTLYDDPPALGWATLFAVGGGGILSFLRHAVFHRADAERIGWTSSRTNAFQIEVGLANLAWGAFAVAAVVLDWGLAAASAAFLIFGFYMASVGVFEVASARGDNARSWAQVIPSIAFGAILLYIGFVGMNAAT